MAYKDKATKQAADKAYYLANKSRCDAVNRIGWYRANYGISLSDWFVMYMEQGGKCAACDRVPTGKAPTDRLHLDHNHSTGQRRKLLCSKCNQALGLLGESLERIDNLKDYLRPYVANGVQA